MQRYKEYSPTGFDTKGLNGESAGISDWLVAPCGNNRDTNPGSIECSNWHSVIESMKKIQPNEAEENDDGTLDGDWQIHRFGHWACGWFEILVVRPGSKCAEEAERLEKRILDYPVLDEDDWSSRECKYAMESWDNMSVRERAELCVRYGHSKFAGRRGIPENDDGRIWDYLRAD